MADWAELVPDLLHMIAKRIKSIEDFIAFSIVCTTWREATLSEDSNQSIQPIWWLMLAGTKNEKIYEEHAGLEAALLPRKSRRRIISFQNQEDCIIIPEFYCLTNDKIKKIPLPLETRGKKVLGTKGWLVIVSRGERDLSLFHPLWRTVIPLPPRSAGSFFRLANCFHFLNKAVLSSDPYCDRTDYILMVIHDCRTSFWRPGDKEWTVISTRNTGCSMDIIYCGGQFYVVSSCGFICLCDVRGLNPTVAVPLGRIPMDLTNVTPLLYLAGKTNNNSSSMLLLVRLLVINDYTKRYETCSFKVYDVDLSGCQTDGMFTEVNRLDSQTVFVGYNESICLRTSEFPSATIKSNCIYFTEDCCLSYSSRHPETENCPHRVGSNIRIFNLEDGTIELF